ncbi:MAG: DUF4340 domain-containing protein [Chlorobi bacterium]|nr:DUF4340 domain-containing protein [Chlorobiota bacterium]
MNFKSLAIVFVLLLAIVIVLKIYESKKGDRSFRKELVNFDKTQATAITIIPKAGKEQIKLTKKADNWKVSSKGKSFNADKTMVDNMLEELLKLKPKRVAATTKDKWKEFEVIDSVGTRVLVNQDKKALADIYIGKFSYKQPKNQYQRQGTMISYVRLNNDKIVYAVDGFLSMTYNRDINSYRNKYLVKTKKQDINKLSFIYPDSSFTMLKQNNKWMIDGLLADSATVAKYLSSIAVTSNQNFVDDIDVNTLGKEQYSLIIEGDNFVPFNIKLYNNLLDSVNNKLITSTYNNGTVFNGTKSDLVNKLFVGKSKFLK